MNFLKKINKQLYYIVFCLAVIWGVEIINLILNYHLNSFGIHPRSLHGLIGIPLSPFLHASLRHAFLNSIPFAVMGGMIVLQSKRLFVEVSLFVIVCGGAAVWLFGRGSVHVGASGVVFGYFGFLLANGWFERSIRSVIISVLTALLYGGLMWGMLPRFDCVSWESHLFGFVSGVVVASLKAKNNR